MLHTPMALLRFVARASLNAVGGGILGDFAIDVIPDIARDVWKHWSAGKTPPQMHAELQALAQAPPAEVREAARQAAAEAAPELNLEMRERLADYVAQVPALVRRTLRRPSDPSGATVP